MKNLHLDISSEGASELERALQIAWARCSEGLVTHYKIARASKLTRYTGTPVTAHKSHWVELADSGLPTLSLSEGEQPGYLQLPYPLDFVQAVAFVQGFLSRADYGPQPDHDGDNGKGWRVFTGSWGAPDAPVHNVVSIQPAWAMYGK